jgi:hypothetical protein
MGRIGAGQFERATWNVKDTAELRLGSDRELKSAPRNIFGRAVRWLFGATKQDRADNKQIMGNLLANLKQKYGPELGLRAFLTGVGDNARVTQDGAVEVRPDKPLTARQVRKAERTAVESKMSATKDAKRVMTHLGKQDGLQPDGLAKDFVSLARFSGTAKEAVIRDGLWEAKDPKLVETARYDSGKSKPEREQAHGILKRDSKTRFDNALKLLAASKLAGDPPAGHDLVGTAAQLVRQTGKDTGRQDHEIEQMIRSVRTDNPPQDIKQLAVAIKNAAPQVS